MTNANQAHWVFKGHGVQVSQFQGSDLADSSTGSGHGR